MANSMDLLTVEEAANELRVSRHTMRSWVSQKRITYQKIGRRVFFKRTVLQDFIESSTVKAYKPKGGAY
jgi:excisionase family DNA binding protein